MNINFDCSTCSKHPENSIPIARILDKIDRLFRRNDLVEVGNVLDYWENEARRIHDDRALLEILNEKIGFYRRTADKEKGLASVNEAFDIIERLQIGDLESSGTVYLNGATTMKAFGKAADAIEYYEKARSIYTRTLDKNDFRLAAFYNNISSAYKELGEYKKCEESCLEAISILENNGGYLGEMAVSHINLAHLYYELDNFDERVYERMEKAWELLMDSNNVHDGNFAFICSKCHPSFGFFGYFEYERTLKEITERIYEGN